ncbi:hypothetical protein [Limosilactobacillus galli]|uniref:hypothetical protein n=1 Tax=Limosilactobacillus galli TaxID=2991834 RepID=UPI0024BB7B31|nr:hypothetical protein [Limosilactobacillus galli]
MQRSKIIYLLPGIEGKLHAINAADIGKLIISKGGYDALVSKDEAGYMALAMPGGTIKRYFNTKEWQKIVE